MDDLQRKWNDRWREKAGEPLTADPWLLETGDLMPMTGCALDLACGRGRNALALARRGLTVTALDLSAEALAQLASTAAGEGLQIHCIRCDLENLPPQLTQEYDLLLCFFFLHRPLFPWLQAAVRPGGLAILRTFSSAGNFPPVELEPRFVLHPGELQERFSGWEILRHEEGMEPSRKGGSLAGIVARKPSV